MGKFLSAFLAVSLSAFSADPFVGTWKPIVEKSKLSSGSPEWRKTQTLTVESLGRDKYRVNNKNMAGASGPEPSLEFIVDGKEHKADDGVTKIERINERHFKVTSSRAERKTILDYLISADGKTLTLTRKGVGLISGRPVDEVLIYAKQ